MKNSRIILPVLALALIASLYWSWQNYPRVRRVTDGTAAGSDTSSGQAVAVDSGSRLNFAAQDEVEYHAPRRDLFAKLFPPPKVVKPKVKPQEIKPRVVEVVAPPSPPPPPPPPPVVSAPVARMPAFQALGYLEKKGALTAFVSVAGEIYLVRQGEVIANEYKVSELTPNGITIVRTQGEGTVSLPLGEAGGQGSVGSGRGMPPAGHPPLGGRQ